MVVVPSDEPEADDAAERFRRQGYLLAPGLIDPGLTAFLWSYVSTKFASLLVTGRSELFPTTPAEYGDPTFDGLLEHLRPRIEAATGIWLNPTYSYYRLYKHGDVLPRHRDRPACEVSLSLNLGQSPAEPWPFFLEYGGASCAVSLSPGDAVIYRGCKAFHWRDAFPGQQLAQVFLHYVDGEGPHADEKFDGRQSLMRPRIDGQQPTTGMH
jgi:hypothetical protein